MARVLIIEDSPLVVQMLTMVCEMAGHEVAACMSFAEVPSKLESFKPEVILTDLNLPGLREDNAVEALRKDSELSEAPIIIISGRPKSELEVIAKDSGAQGALSKDDGMPVISQELPLLIESLLSP